MIKSLSLIHNAKIVMLSAANSPTLYLFIRLMLNTASPAKIYFTISNNRFKKSTTLIPNVPYTQSGILSFSFGIPFLHIHE